MVGTTAEYSPTRVSSSKAPGEDGAQNAFVVEILVQRQLSLGVQDRHFRAGAGSAGRAIDGAGPGGGAVPIQLTGGDNHRILGMRIRTRRWTGKLRDGHAGKAGLFRVDDRQLLSGGGLSI